MQLAIEQNYLKKHASDQEKDDNVLHCQKKVTAFFMRLLHLQEGLTQRHKYK